MGKLGGRSVWHLWRDEEGAVLLVLRPPYLHCRQRGVAHRDLAQLIARAVRVHDLLQHVAVAASAWGGGSEEGGG